MKKILIYGSFLFLLSCKAQTSFKNELTLISECPKDGTCEIELYQNKSLVLLVDQLGGMYYELQETPGKSVIHFQYNKTTQANLQDGHYREDVLFEINHDTKSLNLQNTALQQTKLIFGRHCFCKGQTGYFKMENGNLTIQEAEKKLQVKVDFSTPKIPQIIRSIEATIN